MSQDALMVGISFPVRPELHDYINENEEEFCEKYNISSSEEYMPEDTLGLSYCTETGKPYVIYTIYEACSDDGIRSRLSLNESIFRIAWQKVKESSRHDLHDCLIRSSGKLFVFLWYSGVDMPGYE